MIRLFEHFSIFYFLSKAGVNPRVLTTEWGDDSRVNIRCPTLVTEPARRHVTFAPMASRKCSFTTSRWASRRRIAVFLLLRPLLWGTFTAVVSYISFLSPTTASLHMYLLRSSALIEPTDLKIFSGNDWLDPNGRVDRQEISGPNETVGLSP